MNLFQWITLPLLGLLFLRDAVGVLFRFPRFRTDRLVRCVLWAAAFVAIANPDLTIALANKLGIQRGADLVLYGFALAFLATSFYFYSRTVRQERQMTDLVRYLAIRDAQLGKK